MAKLKRYQVGELSDSARIEKLLDLPEYGSDYEQLMAEVGRLALAYLKSGRLRRQDWRARYTAGIKKPVLEAARAMDRLVAELAELLSADPAVRDRIISQELRTELEKAPAWMKSETAKL